MLIRRTLPAMAVTLAVFVAARLAVKEWVRPYLIAPLRAISPLDDGHGHRPDAAPGAGVVKPGDWVLSAQTINGAGQVIGQYGGIGPNGSIGFQRVQRTVSLVGVGPCPNTFPAAASAARAPTQEPSASFNAAAQECISKLGIETSSPTSR